MKFSVTDSVTSLSPSHGTSRLAVNVTENIRLKLMSCDVSEFVSMATTNFEVRRQLFHFCTFPRDVGADVVRVHPRRQKHVQLTVGADCGGRDWSLLNRVFTARFTKPRQRALSQY